jgi:hypothetical protein
MPHRLRQGGSGVECVTAGVTSLLSSSIPAMTPPLPVATCRRCASTSLQAVRSSTKSVGSAVLGEMMLGTAAGIAASSRSDIRNVCLNCGLQYFAGSAAERRIRALSGQLGPEAKAAESAMQKEAACVEAELERRRSLTVIGFVVFFILLGALALFRG